MLRLSSHFLAFSLITAAFAAPQTPPAPQQKKVETFKPFTGKIEANKVRVRAKADLESHIIRQMSKNDLLLIVGEVGDFYAVEPFKDAKAYVFRSYILDGIVEANRVNVRLGPQVDSPIIGQLQAGDRVSGNVCALNHKWLEIAPPKGTKFYVSKEFVTKAGGPEFLAVTEKRQKEVEELSNGAFALAEAECKKPFEEMNPQPAIEKFQTILKSYNDFQEIAAQAKEALALLKETYLNKKIAFLESKAELSPTAKEELIAKHKEENRDLLTNGKVNPKLFDNRNLKREMTPSMQMWDTLEESLYVSWSSFHTHKKMNDFYAEQKANATVLTGVIEEYPHKILDKPGDFVLKSRDMPIAYLYSTHVDLEKLKGKSVTLLAAPRPNNHFAFPAYFVLSIEP